VAKACDYMGAGTVESLLDENNNFYFREMNTRLQVEHPVTEMVTGFDLVKLQIDAAEGKAFDFKQSDISQTGHSVEVRIYAEDPDNDFLPTIGKIQEIGFSKEEGVRLDCGFDDQTQISVNYDPMIAKLIVHADSRALALDKMDRAINDIKFSGVKTNRDYLKRILNHTSFKNGTVTTSFIEKYKKDLNKRELDNDVIATMIAGAIFSDNKSIDATNQSSDSWDTQTNFRNV
jgi:3-methylcrotonyl-CoA carboxylase alpha subunit